MRLWHFTCGDGAHEIARAGHVEPSPVTGLAWFTSDPHAAREHLGLTSHLLSCDRMAHRFRVTDTRGCIPWVEYRSSLPAVERDMYEAADGLRPETWWVAEVPVPARYARRP